MSKNYSKLSISKDYKHSCYKLLQKSGLLNNGHFKSKKYIDNNSKAAQNKKQCRKIGSAE